MELIKKFPTFKHAKITHESTPDEIRAEIDRLNVLKNIKHDVEQAIKIFINSIYGAMANKYFVGYNVNVAEATTLQAQEINKFAARQVNAYGRRLWHKDKDLHAHLGVTDVNPIEEDMLVYGDTDSCYFSFKAMYDSCNYDGSAKEFILAVYEFRLKNFIDRQFDIFAKKRNTENYQKFELEAIIERAIFVEKKKYVYTPVWKEPGINIEPYSKISAKGLEMVRTTTPKIVRDKLYEICEWLLRRGRDYDHAEFIHYISEFKKVYQQKASSIDKIDEVVKGSSISDYEKYIVNDIDELIFSEKCPIYVRAAGIYNHHIRREGLDDRYKFIKSGDKIKYYYTKIMRPGQSEVFGYLPGTFPYEIAPAIDINKMFEKDVISPINSILLSMNYPMLTSNLILTETLY